MNMNRHKPIDIEFTGISFHYIVDKKKKKKININR